MGLTHAWEYHTKLLHHFKGLPHTIRAQAQSLQVWWTKAKDFRLYMCLRWQYFVSRLVSTYIELIFKFKTELELEQIMSSSSLNLKSN